MKAFTYERASDPVAAARAVAGRPDAKFIAGGTNLLDLMKLQVESPAHLVDVQDLGLDKIEATADAGLRIGALVTNTDLATDERVRRDYAVLTRSIVAGASGQLRNKATTGGTERVNEFETPGSRIQAWSVSVFGGGLIHAAIGLAGGLGVALTKRCGFSVKARSRTVWRASIDRVGLAVMDLIRCHQTQSAVVMITIVPIEEGSTEGPGILDAAEALPETPVDT